MQAAGPQGLQCTWPGGHRKDICISGTVLAPASPGPEAKAGRALKGRSWDQSRQHHIDMEWEHHTGKSECFRA